MARVTLTAIAAGILAVSFGTTGGAEGKTEYVSYAGHWVWNAKESHHDAALPAQAQETLDVTDDGKTVTIHDVATMADGKTATHEFKGAYDGKPAEMGDGMSNAMKHVSANSFSNRWTMKGVGHGHDVCTYSDDHSTLTCKGTETFGKKTTPYIDVWNKS